MPTKVFTTLGGLCPFGRGIEIDSLTCRRCSYYYRTGTEMFFWCNHPGESVPKSAESVQKSAGTVQKTGKRGRPAKKAKKKPVNKREKKNG